MSAYLLKSLCAVAIAVATTVPGRAEAPPNILFVIADDYAYEALGAMGNDEVLTPNLDRLAERGVTFTHAYNMGGWNGAVCIASRTMLNTGRFLWSAHRMEDRLASEVEAGRTWPQLLAKAGYDTYMTGKWHIAANTAHMFDYVAHERPGMPGPTRYEELYNRPIEGRPDPWDPTEKSFLGFWAGGRHWSEVLADDAEMFLANAARSEAPFFMYLAFNAPHDPRQAPREYIERYDPADLRLPPSFAPEYPHKDAIGCGLKMRDERLAPFPRTPYAVRKHRAEYYAIITHLDAQIGRILDALEATGKADRTVIIFTADHGLAVGHHGFMGKQNLYEHSLRPPLILAGPGLPKGKKIDTRVYYQDVMPTTLELAGVEVPAQVEFKSLLPLIRGERREQYSRIYAAYQRDYQRAIIQDEFKLIHYPHIDTYRLYNLEEDPDERSDLAADPAHQPVLQRLRSNLVGLQVEMRDPILSAR